MFSEGLAGVRIDGRWGFIDETGATVIAPRFDLVGAFHRGRAEVLVGNRAGVIDRQGNVVLEPTFAAAIPLTEDLVLAREGGQGRGRYHDGRQLPGVSDPLSLILATDSGLYSIRSGWLVRPPLAVQLFDIDRGLIWASRDGQTFGLMRTDGTWQLKPRFSDVWPLRDGRAVACERASNGSPPTPTGRICGAVDENGEVVVPLQFDFVEVWQNGSMLARKGGKAGFLDKSGNPIGGKLFDGAQFDDWLEIGKVLVDGTWFALDRDGQLTALSDLHTVIGSCPSGVKLVQTGDTVQVVGAEGQPTVPYPLEYSYNILECDKPSYVRRGSKWGLLGTDGRLLFDPLPFDREFRFINGHAAVVIGGKWAIIDEAGQFSVEPLYDEMRLGAPGLCPLHSLDCEWKTGLYHVSQDGRQFWIDANGQEQPAPPPDRNAYLLCGDEGAHARYVEGGEGRLWGIVDASGHDIIAPRYRAIQCFSGGVAWVPDDGNHQWCPLGPDGAPRDHPDCMPRRYPEEWTDSYPQPFSSDPYENSVLYTQAFLEFGAGLRDEAPVWCGDFASNPRPQCKRPQRKPIDLPPRKAPGK